MNKDELKERIRVMQAALDGAHIQAYERGSGLLANEGTAYNWGWDWISFIYRVKSALEIPWEVLDPKWKWAAMDQSGRIMVYTNKPFQGTNIWNYTEGAHFVLTDIFRLAGQDTSLIDWKNSLTQRPEGV
jgi:hypothetical protein